jgi:hypothetical protein
MEVADNAVVLINGKFLSSLGGITNCPETDTAEV